MANVQNIAFSVFSIQCFVKDRAVLMSVTRNKTSFTSAHVIMNGSGPNLVFHCLCSFCC